MNTQDHCYYSDLPSPLSYMRHSEELELEFELELDTDKIIEMALKDRTPFESILFEYGLSRLELIKLMRTELKRSSFNTWMRGVDRAPKEGRKKRSKDSTRLRYGRQKGFSERRSTKK